MTIDNQNAIHPIFPPTPAGTAPVDTVNHPPHYKASASGVEAIQITEHLGFNLGNAFKYLMRRDHKGDSPIEHLRKALWYVDRACLGHAGASYLREAVYYRSGIYGREELALKRAFEVAAHEPTRIAIVMIAIATAALGRAPSSVLLQARGLLADELHDLGFTETKSERDDDL